MPQLILQNQAIDYTLKRSRKARCMRLAVKSDASVTVTVPFFVTKNYFEKIIEAKASWLLAKISLFKNRPPTLLRTSTRQEYLRNKLAAERFIKTRLVEINKSYNFSFRKVTVKNLKTRWGSCSKTGNLNFSYKLLFLPAEIADYIIVHELCHLKQFNHSPKFWDLVNQIVPNYKLIKTKLRNEI